MIRVQSPIPEPQNFDANCRQNGAQWIKDNPALSSRPRDFWSEFRDDLREGFQRRCGYLAMYIHDGTVDHFISWKNCKTTRPELAYEWSNMRFIAGSLNSSKGSLDGQMLDPFQVQDDWFEIGLPDLILHVTSHIPALLRDKAFNTIDRFGLQDGRRIIKLRWEWYEKYRTGNITLECLYQDAPLVARAVDKWNSESREPLPTIPRPR